MKRTQSKSHQIEISGVQLLFYLQKRRGETSSLRPTSCAPGRKELKKFLCHSFMIKDIYLMMELRDYRMVQRDLLLRFS